jgi:hypothetical protein
MTLGSSRLPLIWVVSSWMLSLDFAPFAGAATAPVVGLVVAPVVAPVTGLAGFPAGTGTGTGTAAGPGRAFGAGATAGPGAGGAGEVCTAGSRSCCAWTVTASNIKPSAASPDGNAVFDTLIDALMWGLRDPLLPWHRARPVLAPPSA